MTPRSFTGWLLRVPLAFKILLANSAIVALGALAGTIVTVWHVETFPNDFHYELIALFATLGLAISFAVNYFVLKLALTPLDRLQQAVDQVRQGKLDVQATTGALSDDRFDRLTETFNQMVAVQEQATQQLHHLSQEILQAQEDERQRVARELHDQTAQSLTSLLVRLRLLERAQDPSDAQKHVQELRDLTAQSLDEVRRVALELRPKILDDLGLAEALAWRVDELNAGETTHVALNVTGIEKRMPRNLELVFYRVAQEALTNIARHSRAKNAYVTLRREDHGIALQVIDDGVGFDVNAIEARQSHGLGLFGMRERMALVGGSLSVESKGGQGTRLVAVAPLKAERGVGETHLLQKIERG